MKAIALDTIIALVVAVTQERFKTTVSCHYVPPQVQHPYNAAAGALKILNKQTATLIKEYLIKLAKFVTNIIKLHRKILSRQIPCPS